MLTTHRFNRRRAAEIRARHRERRERAQHIEMVSMHCSAMGVFNPYAPRLPGETFDQAYARFRAERLRMMAEADRQADIEMRRLDAGQACGAAVAAHAKSLPGFLARLQRWF